MTNDRPDLSSEGAPAIDKTVLVNVNRNKYPVVRPTWALKPGLTDRLVVGRNVTLTLTLTGPQFMIVCLNPSAEDYGETIHIMEFAEMTKEVQVDFALPPSRRKDSPILKGALQKMEENFNGECQVIAVDIGHSTDAKNKCPEKAIDSPISLKRPLPLEWEEEFRNLSRKLSDIEKEILLFEDKLSISKTQLDQEREKEML
jgi:hypothetical protein